MTVAMSKPVNNPPDGWSVLAFLNTYPPPGPSAPPPAVPSWSMTIYVVCADAP
jgi:hypothetical protein